MQEGWWLVLKATMPHYKFHNMSDKNYTIVKYSVSIEIPKFTEDVFKHITKNVSKFWPEDFEGKSDNLDEEFVLRTGDSHFSKNKVVEFELNKRVVWLVTESIRKEDGFEWTGTKMFFELTPKTDKTLLQFIYDGIILENEYDRLVQVCDMVIKTMLYNSIMADNTQ